MNPAAHFCEVCKHGPLFSWEKHPGCTAKTTICRKCADDLMMGPPIIVLHGATLATLKITAPMEPVEFAFAPDADEFDNWSMRCCHGIGEAPRCRMKATRIPIYSSGQLAGDAYCRDHVPVKKKGSWYIPLRCVVVER